jgi:hypothetical protein
MIAFITGGQLITGQGDYSSQIFSDYFSIDPVEPKQLSSFTVNPTNQTYGPFSFSYSDNGYVLTNRQLLKFDNVISGFSTICQFPGDAIGYQSGFVSGDKLYVGTGRNVAGQTVDEFWEYNLLSGIWTRKANYPGGTMSGGTAFTINGKGYMGFGTPNQKNLYEYDPATDTWNLKSEIPDFFTDIDKDRYALVSIAAGGKAVVGLGRHSTVSAFGDMYSYDPLENRWERLTGLTPPMNLSYSVMVTDGEYGYIIGGIGLTWPTVIKFKISDL